MLQLIFPRFCYANLWIIFHYFSICLSFKNKHKHIIPGSDASHMVPIYRAVTMSRGYEIFINIVITALTLPFILLHIY